MAYSKTVKFYAGRVKKGVVKVHSKICKSEEFAKHPTYGKEEIRPRKSCAALEEE